MGSLLLPAPPSVGLGAHCALVVEQVLGALGTPLLEPATAPTRVGLQPRQPGAAPASGRAWALQGPVGQHRQGVLHLHLHPEFPSVCLLTGGDECLGHRHGEGAKEGEGGDRRGGRRRPAARRRVSRRLPHLSFRTCSRSLLRRRGEEQMPIRSPRHRLQSTKARLVEAGGGGQLLRHPPPTRSGCLQLQRPC